MVPVALRVADQRLLLGRSEGLPQATATVEIRVDGEVGESALARIRTGAESLRPGRLLLGLAHSDWPAAFLLETAGGEPSPPVMLGEWIVALTVALQRWAGDPVWRGRVVSADCDTIRLAVPWQRSGVLSDTLRLAVNLAELWAGAPSGRQPDVNAAIDHGMRAAREGGLGTDPLRLALTALERGIPTEMRPGHVQYGWGAGLQRLHSTITGSTSYVAGTIAGDKAETVRILAEAGLPVPAGSVVGSFADARRVVTDLGWPVAVKPLNQEQGRGVTAGIGDEDALRRAYSAARRFSPNGVLVERHIDGADHRLWVVNGRCIAAHRRIPGGVTGDGLSTVAGLLDRLNADPSRGSDGRFLMKKISLDDEALECLGKQGLSVDDVPAAGRWVRLRSIANVSAGGTAADVTEDVHPDNLMIAERAARIVGLDIAGIDLLTPDIGRSWRAAGGAICEVNAFPELGDPVRDTYGHILDSLFGTGSGRIPTAVITGAGGPGVAVLLHRIWTVAGRVAGLCSEHTVRIGAEVVAGENSGGLPRGGIVLNDPAVEAAIFELRWAELAAIGNPCDRYDVAAVVDADEPSRYWYAELVARADVVIADAGDPTCAELRQSGAGPRRWILAAPDVSTPDLVEHLNAGGEGVFPDRHDGRRWLVAAAGDRRTPLVPLDDLDPDGGQRDALFAAAMAWCHGLAPASILAGLSRSRTQPPTR